jgi:hypothetical protein
LSSKSLWSHWKLAVMAQQEGLTPLPELLHSVTEKEGGLTTPEEKSTSDNEVYDSEKGSQIHDFIHEEDVSLVNGEPVINSGKDVSRFVIDLRDDGDPALTFRSMVLGTVFAGLFAFYCS